MTNLSDLFPAGAGKQVSFIASGTLSNGQTLALKSNGQVEAISATGGGGVIGTPTAANSNRVGTVRSAYDPDSGKVIIVYQDSGGTAYGFYVIGTVSGTAITYGTPAVIVSYSFGSAADVVYDTVNDKVVVAWRGSAGHGQVKIGTVSGTTISFGTQVEFNASASNDIMCAFRTVGGSPRVLICYADGGNSYNATAILGTVSGTSISFGTAVVVYTGRWKEPQPAYSPLYGVFLVTYRDNANSDYPTARTLSTSSGNTYVTAGAATILASTSVDETVCVYVTSNYRFAMFMRHSSNGYGIPLSITGTDPNWTVVAGNTATFDAGNTPYSLASDYDALSQTCLVSFRQNSTGLSKYTLASLSGSNATATITFSALTTFDTNSIGDYPYAGVVYDTASSATVVSYRGGSDYLTSTVIKTASSNNTSFIGIADGAISSAASGNVTIKGGIAASGLSSLTPAADYYVQTDGTISTSSAGVKIGKAMSATAINLEYSS